MTSIEPKDIASDLKILKAAEEIFAEQGFDGARVDEIAKRAGVNKALIYYYFESKERILEELSKRHLSEILNLKNDLLKGLQSSENDLNRDTLGKLIETSLWMIFDNRKDFLGIVLIEALKNKSCDTTFFHLINQVYDDYLARFHEMGYQIDGDMLKTLAFFFGIVPVIFYITMWEKWAEFNHIDKEKVRSTFVDAFTEIQFSLFIDKFNLAFNRKMMDSFIQDNFSSALDKKSINEPHE
jgi:AcrR family transcriptional regulator